MIFQNSPTPLTIPTHEGSGQAVHPSIIDFKVEHNKETWGGYRYWMAMTPYPFTDDAEEDPNLIASNDNINWVVPNGIINPLDDALGGMDAGFHNDPDMVYNPDTNELWLYYRFSSYAKQEIKLIRVSENMVTTAPIVVHLLAPFTQETNKTRSMGFWRESSTKWHMWSSGGARPYTNYYYFSTNGIDWGAPQQVLNQNGVDAFHAIGYENWHLSCKPNVKEGRIEFLTHCWTLGGGNDRNAKIIYSEIPINNPTLMLTPKSNPILGAGSGWDNGFLYRCSFVIEDLGDYYKYHLYYSARSSSNVWGIGYTSYTEPNPIEPVNPNVPRDEGVYWHDVSFSMFNGLDIKETKIKISDWHDVKGVFIKR